MTTVLRGGGAVQLREKKDEAATRDRFWDVTQSKIGQLTGTTAGEDADAAAHAADASKTAAKFAGSDAHVDDGALSPAQHLLAMTWSDLNTYRS